MPYQLKSNHKNLVVGRDTFYNGKIYIKGRGAITIGNYCAFGDNLRIIAGNNHNYHYPAIQVSFYRQHFGRYPASIPESGISIGSDVWIGDNVTILDGVSIGNGCCIGAGAVVAASFPDFSILGGVPARLLKTRYNQEIIPFLTEIAWWSWDEQRIKDNREFFHTDLSTVTLDQLKLIVR